MMSSRTKGRRAWRTMAGAFLLLAPWGYGCSAPHLIRGYATDRPADSREAGERSPEGVIRRVASEEVQGDAAGPVVPPAAAEYPIDLPTALGLAGAENPTIALAQEAVRARLAEQLKADALLLPHLQAGVSADIHRGSLLSAQGIVRDVDRQSLYAGFGAAATGGGTVG